MARIIRLRTNRDRLRSDQAEVLRQALLPFAAGEMSHHVGRLITHIDRETASISGWTFVMLSPSQNRAVVRYLAAYSSRPLIAVQLWALCFEHLNHDTGEIMLTRDEIADAVSESSDHVSTIMTELVDCRAISRVRERIDGMRGPGRVKYYMNPLVGTHLAGQERDQAQAKALELRLV